MIKVLNVITDTNIGGAGRILVHYLKNFDREKFDVCVAVPEGSLLIPEIRAVGYDVIETKYGKDESFELPAVRELYGIIKRLSPDIVHTHSSLSARVAAYLAGVKSRIYTRHCAYDLPRSATSFPKKQISGLVNNTLSTKIIAVAPAAAKNLTDTGVDPKKITVIMNGVEPVREADGAELLALREKYGLSDTDFVCSICARLEDVKGHEYLIKAAKIIAEKTKNIKFLIVGTGSIEAELHELANRLGVSDTVIFTGFMSDTAPVLGVSDIALNCSWGTEASSLAIAEAMSLGLPTVASDFGGNPSVIGDGVNGILYEKKNEAALAEAILRVWSDKALYAELCEGARRVFYEKFTSGVMTRRLEAVYAAEAERIRADGKA